jgi:hypothetical protein
VNAITAKDSPIDIRLRAVGGSTLVSVRAGQFGSLPESVRIVNQIAKRLGEAPLPEAAPAEEKKTEEPAAEPAAKPAAKTEDTPLEAIRKEAPPAEAPAAKPAEKSAEPKVETTPPTPVPADDAPQWGQ